MTNEEAIEQLRYLKHGVKAESEQDDALDLAITALERDRWISVEERLPENADIYLCTLMSYAGKFRYIDTLKYIGGFFYENGVGTDRVTHWRPLPEPPKEET